MKKQTFYRQKQLKSQKSLENITNNNSFNNKDYGYDNLKNKEKNETGNILKNREKNINNRNTKKNIIDKKGKIGCFDYEIEPRNIILIPDNSQINFNDLKICEKELLPKEKNYFISEKNFQLLKDTLNEKEEIIKELNYLLEKSKNENNKVIINKEDNSEKVKTLEEENKKYEKINNELIYQIEKKNIYFNKIYQLLKFVFNHKALENDEITNFIKEQDLEILFDNDEFNNDKENNLIDILFTTNKDMIMNDLENYKKKYNDIRKQLNYITNLKYDNNNNNSKEIIIEYQKRINELYLSNQNHIKENAYLKLMCQNIFLDKKINNLDKNGYELKNQLKEKNEYIKKIENINTDLEKKIELLKNDKESLSKMINNLNKDIENNKEEYEIKIKQLSMKYDFVKLENEKLEKSIIDNKQKENEKKNIFFENLALTKVENILYKSEKNRNEINERKDLINNYQNNNNYNNNIQNENLDLLMLLYNKSKTLEEYINNNNENSY